MLSGLTVKGLVLALGVLVAVSAGELSGRLLAEAVCREFGQNGIERLDLVGPGGPGPVLGFWEGIRAAPQVGRALKKALDAIRSRRPDVVLLVAFPGLNLRLGAAARRAGIPVVYLAPPQVWAWGAGRTRALRNAADRVVCLFPFERPVLEKAGVRAEFLGYPLLDALMAESGAARGPGGDHVAFLPGSRPAEIAYHRPLFAAAMAEMAKTGPGVRAQWVEAPESESEGGLLAAARERYRLMAGARAAAVVSGTATLETALLGVPQVASYHLSPATRLLARALVRTRFFALPNILAGEQVVSELLEPTAGQVAGELRRQLAPGGRARARVLAGQLAALLGPAGACRRIERFVLDTARAGVRV